MPSFFEIKPYQSNEKIKSNLKEKNHLSANKPLAVISGAGIAGLAASIELASSGYEVIIIETRDKFTRSNVINLDIDVQRFLIKHNILERFESEVAAKIQTHKVIHFSKKGHQILDSTDVSNDIQSREIDAVLDDITQVDKMFKRNGFYSASIKDIQHFLAKEAIQRGVNIRYETQINEIEKSKEGVVLSLKLKSHSSQLNDDEKKLEPDLLVIAEGTQSKNAKDELEMNYEEIVTECTGENWGFGNVDYNAEETFVVSTLDTTENNVQISNVIFNGKAKIINTAVTVEPYMSPKDIKKEVSNVLQKVLKHKEPEQMKQFKTHEMFEELNRLEQVERIKQSNESTHENLENSLKEYQQVKASIVLLLVSLQQLIIDVPNINDVSEKPVEIKNLKRSVFFKGNTLCIGDSAGSSSPLAGLGGTLALTMYPIIIEKFAHYIKNKLPNSNKILHAYLEATVDAWIKKAEEVKKSIIGLAASDLTTAANETQQEQNTVIGRP